MKGSPTFSKDAAGNFVFLATKGDASGDTDDVCRLCFDWCTEHSACSNRYHVLQGYYLSEYSPEGYKQIKYPVAVPICDKCYDNTRVVDWGDKHPFIILGKMFLMECINRVND